MPTVVAESLLADQSLIGFSNTVPIAHSAISLRHVRAYFVLRDLYKGIGMEFTQYLSRRAGRSILASIVCFALASGQYLCAQGKDLPDGKGKDKVIKSCTSCHGTEEIISHKLDRQGWVDLIEDMKRLGLELKKPDYDDVLEYLVTNFNGAPAKPKQAR
ncbi:MAG: hypothetical protein ABI759_25690 [Candidatus Solibacter sp.]